MAITKVPDKAKLNKFVYTSIPHPSVLMSRLGNRTPLANQYSGDEVLDFHQNKTDMIMEADREFSREIANLKDDE